VRRARRTGSPSYEVSRQRELEAPATRHPPPATRHPPPATRHPSPVTRHPHF
jgi:hypothetical protein